MGCRRHQFWGYLSTSKDLQNISNHVSCLLNFHKWSSCEISPLPVVKLSKKNPRSHPTGLQHPKMRRDLLLPGRKPSPTVQAQPSIAWRSSWPPQFLHARKACREVEATWKSLKKEKSKLGRKSDPVITVILGIWAWVQLYMGIPLINGLFVFLHLSINPLVHKKRPKGVGPSAE